MATSVTGVRAQIAAASKRIARAKLFDRAATSVITLGGIALIASVLFIFVFIFAEALPLFRSATADKVATLTPARAGDGPREAPLVFGVDEYQKYLYEVTRAGTVAVFRAADGARQRELPIPGLEGAVVTAAARSLTGDAHAAAGADGRVVLFQVRFRPVFEEQAVKDLVVEVRSQGVFEVDTRRRPVREIATRLSSDGEIWTAAVLADDEIVVARVGEVTEGDTPAPASLETLRVNPGERITRVRLGRATLVAATEAGRLYHWELARPESRLTDVVDAGGAPLTAVEYALGGGTLIVGDRDGHISAWFRARPDPDADFVLVRAHQFESQGAPVLSLAPSTRERSFVSGGADGSLVLRHLTSERTLLRLDATGRPVDAILVAPRADGLLVRRGDEVERYTLSNPHPEFSWRALFGKVWYEGYPRPEYVWQSTGSTDDFESKLSLIPLVFGTVKATFYALVFAVPLAVLGALYTSQFVHPAIRAKVKPAVEIMAALPSVVIGFVGGLWLAARVEAKLVPVALLVVLLPSLGTAGVLLWGRLPHGLRRRLKPGTELALILPVLLAGVQLALMIGPHVEALAFGGDVKGWLARALGLVYDQRNSLVVGLAMGFAVIPLIFTISEDAFSSVPRHLTAASLALGASRWQTATRVVLPTASPGIFSAMMIGFGRAVGETMIVLMATGNTPVLDWSVFNGMRTLSANIAVEVPEAPHGGTLYRVLFLSACVLFLMTFCVNTVAELVRQRLRDKYRAL